MELDYEIGPIRPPSEAYSLLIRVTRNYPWNRCKFCHTYKGERFELRPVTDIKQDIDTSRAIQDKIKGRAWQTRDGESIREVAAAFVNSPPNAAFQNVALWLYAGGENAFLQDANSLIMKTGELVEVIKYLKSAFPAIKRITSYCRAHTAARKQPEELRELHDAGLSRLHIGLETGYDPLLEYMDKGATAAAHIAAGRKVVESGISLSEYVILGLGGKGMWQPHATETARVLNEIAPDFIRVRTLAINNRMPLHEEIQNGKFIRATDEEILEEERLLIERLECRSNFVSDHITNLLQEIEGKLPEDKPKMLAAIDSFRSLPPEERLNFRVGRRVGIYTTLEELNEPDKHRAAEQVINRFGHKADHIDEEFIYRITSRFI